MAEGGVYLGGLVDILDDLRDFSEDRDPEDTDSLDIMGEE